jgi:hypothetical protein
MDVFWWQFPTLSILDVTMSISVTLSILDVTYVNFCYTVSILDVTVSISVTVSILDVTCVNFGYAGNCLSVLGQWRDLGKLCKMENTTM